MNGKEMKVVKLSSRKVPGIGPKKARIAIVGEAPGHDENIKGEPFVGIAGKVLGSMLNEAGILRNDCWITNVVKHQPANNNINPLFSDSKQTVPSQEMKDYLVELKEELEAIQPNIVIALGRTAMWALTGKSQIMKHRGSLYESTLIPGLKVIPTMHPAAVARQWVPWRQIIPADLMKAKEESAFPEVLKPDRRFIIEPSYDEVLYYMDFYERVEFMSFDIETRPYKIVSIAFAAETDFALCIPFTKGYNNYWSAEEELGVWKAINRVLSAPSKKVGQNVQYDELYLARFHGVYVQNIWIDTMIAHHELYPETPKGLDFLASLWTKEPYWKDEGKSHGGRVRDHDLWTYNCKDVVVTLEIAHEVFKELQEDGLWNEYLETMKFRHPLMTMSLQGVKFDTAKQTELIKEYKEKIKKLQEGLDNAVGEPVNVSSNKQMVQLLYVTLNLPVQTGKTNRPTADMNALLSLRRKHKKFKPILDVIIDIRKLRKLTEGFLEVETDPIDGRIRCSYNVAGTETWRLSSSGSIFGGGTNLQNQPKGADEEGVVRKLFIPDPGYFMGATDLSQAEARVVALLSDDEIAIHEFETGVDVHTAFAARLFDMPYEELLELADSDPKEYNEMRNLGKMVRHATNYGMTWVGLIKNCMKRGVYLNAKEAKKLLKDADKATPMLSLYHRNVREQLKTNRTIITPLGKRRRFGGRLIGSSADETHRAAYAFSPQSTVGVMANRGMRRIYDELGDAVDLLLQVHDEIVFQFPEDKPELAWRARELMEEEITVRGRSMVIPADLKVGMSWGEMEEIDEKQILLKKCKALRKLRD